MTEVEFHLDNSNDWLGIVKTWCSEEELLKNLTLSQQAKLATRLSFFFYNPEENKDLE